MSPHKSTYSSIIIGMRSAPYQGRVFPSLECYSEVPRRTAGRGRRKPLQAMLAYNYIAEAGLRHCKEESALEAVTANWQTQIIQTRRDKLDAAQRSMLQGMHRTFNRSIGARCGTPQKPGTGA